MIKWNGGLAAIAAMATLQIGTPWTLHGQSDQGRELFQASCAACHTIGGGRLVGPDLLGVGERRSEAWLIAFIQHSQQLVASGDSAAVALFKEYEEMPMPDQPLPAGEVRQILAYIRGATPSDAAPTPVIAEASERQIQLGAKLFQGTASFANSGAPCTSCHDVTGGAITGGGGLARELTTAFSRLGPQGLQSVIANPPFPVMQQVYRDHPLTEDEVVALTGFLRRVAEQPAAAPARALDVSLLVMGVVGSVVLLVLYALLWRRRLKGSVNQRIYDRQITTT